MSEFAGAIIEFFEAYFRLFGAFWGCVAFIAAWFGACMLLYWATRPIARFVRRRRAEKETLKTPTYIYGRWH